MKTGLRRSSEELEKYKKEKIETKFTLKEQPNFKGSKEQLLLMQTYERQYRSGKPMISDEEWDKLLKETNYEESLDETVSPNGRTWIKMKAPLASLKKVQSIKEIKEFVKTFPEGQEFIVSGKLDGLTYDAIYKLVSKNVYKLYSIGTRGDGMNSLILHENALFGVKIDGLPEYITGDAVIELEKRGCVIDGIIELRGEAVTDRYWYKEYRGLDIKTTVARSIAAGIFNRIEPCNFNYIIEILSKYCIDTINKSNDEIWNNISKEGKQFVTKYSLVGKKSKYDAIITYSKEDKNLDLLVRDKDTLNWHTIGNNDYKGKCHEEQLSFISYSIASKQGNIDRGDIIRAIPEINYINDIKCFKNISAKTSNINKIVECIDNFYGTINGVRDLKKERIKIMLKYACDGLVIKPINSNNLTQGLNPVEKNGKIIIQHYPEDQRAIKLPTDKIKTKILKINYKVTKLGNTTVSADITPTIAEGGAVIKCVNLHNPIWLNMPTNSWIKEGIECNLQLSMDIIPVLSKII